jgi:hypothetical protein
LGFPGEGVELASFFDKEAALIGKRTFLIKGWFNETCTPALVEKHSIQKAIQ